MKARRHEHIRLLLTEKPIPSHDRLRRLLAEHGIEVTQATLSRDLRELGVIKTASGYQLPSLLDAAPPVARAARQSSDPLVQHVTGVRTAASMVVLLTTPGSAGVVALDLDRHPPSGVVGTIAGDDTVFVAIASGVSAETVTITLIGRIGLPPAGSWNQHALADTANTEAAS
ncbi:MAG: hypothetical protein AAGB48_04960 [Planctomycetota bacterium]